MTEVIVEARTSPRWWNLSYIAIIAWILVANIAGISMLAYYAVTAYRYARQHDFETITYTVFHASYRCMAVTILIMINNALVKRLRNRIYGLTRAFRILREGDSFRVEGPLRKADVYWIQAFFKEDSTVQKYGKISLKFNESTSTGIELIREPS